MTEHQQLEWKESWRDEHLKWVCAFANGEGGMLVIGRNDRGHYYQRSGSTLQELKGAALDHFLLRRYGRTWDGTPVPGVAVRDLSPAALSRFRTLAARSGRLDATALAEADAELLDKLKLTEGRYLKRAAVLLFHPDPLRFVTGAFVRLGFFRSESDLAYHDEIVGDLFAQAQQTQDLLFTKYLKAAITYEGILRVERFPVPREAMREALLNALVHRDYSVPAPLQIRVYNERLVLVNPAVLPDGWHRPRCWRRIIRTLTTRTSPTPSSAPARSRLGAGAYSASSTPVARRIRLLQWCVSKRTAYGSSSPSRPIIWHTSGARR